MASDFDPEDKYSWYFGTLSRDETNEILNPTDSGVFLVRDSQSIKGDFVLCVKEENKISHYIINRIHVGNSTRFRIGDQEFSDIASLLSFYKTHYLDTTSLIKPVPRERVVAKFDFPGRDPEDLPFRKSEVLDVISKDEKDWWTCRNSRGNVGQVPVPYVSKFDPNNPPVVPPPQTTVPSPPSPTPTQPIKEIQLPAKAVVIHQRIPSAYDRTQLKLEKGETIIVTKMNSNGLWEGEVNGKKGMFPFTHVKFLEDNSEDGT